MLLVRVRTDGPHIPEFTVCCEYRGLSELTRVLERSDQVVNYSVSSTGIKLSPYQCNLSTTDSPKWVERNYEENCV